MCCVLRTRISSSLFLDLKKERVRQVKHLKEKSGSDGQIHRHTLRDERTNPTSKHWKAEIGATEDTPRRVETSKDLA